MDPIDPPDSMANIAAKALAQNAVDGAERDAKRQARSALLRRLPRILHPFVPGGRGSTEEKLKTEVGRQVWGMLFSCLISALVFGFVAAILAFVFGIVAYEIAVSL